jgi:hypothetical protein
MADVFISYKREERALVERIALALQELGISVWFDAALLTGGAFHEEIEREVKAAKAVLVCWTEEAVRSRWVLGEAQIGLDRGVLIPITLSTTSLPPPFNTVHAQSLGGWRGGHGDPAWLALLDRLGALVGRPGLRSLAMAIAAGEPVRVLGANEASPVRGPAKPRFRSSPNPKPARTSAKADVEPEPARFLAHFTAALTFLPMWLVVRLIGDVERVGWPMFILSFSAYVLFAAGFAFAIFVIVPFVAAINGLALILRPRATSTVWRRYFDARKSTIAASLGLLGYGVIANAAGWLSSVTWLRMPFVLIGYLMASAFGAPLAALVLVLQIMPLIVRPRRTLSAWQQQFDGRADEAEPEVTEAQAA